MCRPNDDLLKVETKKAKIEEEAKKYKYFKFKNASSFIPSRFWSYTFYTEEDFSKLNNLEKSGVRNVGPMELEIIKKTLRKGIL